MLAAELIDFMAKKSNQKNNLLNLVKNPRLVVFNCIVADCFQRKILFQPVNDFNLSKRYQNSAGSATNHIVDFVCLYGDLNFAVARDKRHHHVPTWFTNLIKDCATTVVDCDVALIYLVKTCHYDRYNEYS
jgi:hypothetical protein